MQKKYLTKLNWSFQSAVLEKTLESPLDSKEIKPINPKGNRPWIFIGRTDAEAEAPILWSSDEKSRLIGKDPDAGKDWRQEIGKQEIKLSSFLSLKKFYLFIFGPCHAACRILVPWPGPCQWKCQVQTTGPPGNFHVFIF